MRAKSPESKYVRSFDTTVWSAQFTVGMREGWGIGVCAGDGYLELVLEQVSFFRELSVEVEEALLTGGERLWGVW